MSSEKELVGASIKSLQDLIAKREVSAVEITKAHIAQIEAHESEVGAFLECNFENSLKRAAEQDALLASGAEQAPLSGIPVALKDNMCEPGFHTTCGSKILTGFASPYRGTAPQKLHDAGAIVLGKTNLDEFAMGSSTEHSAYKQTRNPINLDYVPGGSSGGSAAAVKAGFCTASLGSDTGGSIRQPAAFCGLVGMKPTYGTVSRFGLVAFASSLDQIGPFARSVEDCATMVSLIQGFDPKDSTSLNPDYRQKNTREPVDAVFIAKLAASSCEEKLKGLKVGLIKELMGEGIDASVRESVGQAAERLSQAGATVEEVSLPHVRYALPVYYIVATAEASANLARFDGVRYGHRNLDAEELHAMYYATRGEGFGAEVKRRIMLGTYALSTGYYEAYYKKAQQVRRLITNDFSKLFETYDLLISPTSPTTAFKLGEKTSDPLQMYMSDIASIPANLAGLPGISLPCGVADGLPIGLQMLGAPLSDGTLLRAAHGLESLLNLEIGSLFLKAKIKSS